MSIVLYGKKIDVPDTACWLDPPEVVRAVTGGRASKIPKSNEGYKRDPAEDWMSGHVTHTNNGTVKALDKQPFISSVMDWIYAAYGVREDDKSWSLSKDLDETAIQTMDPGYRAPFQAGRVNEFTDGWELMQTKDGTLTTRQLDGYLRLCDEWSYHCGIPRVIAWRDGAPFLGMLTRALAAYGSGKSLCLFYGHCNIWSLKKDGKTLTAVRGHGDPSHLPFMRLHEGSYMSLDVEKGEDLVMWKDIQSSLGLQPDGIPGPDTRAALIASGKYGAGGMLVARPLDETRGTPAWLAARPKRWRQERGVWSESQA